MHCDDLMDLIERSDDGLDGRKAIDDAGTRGTPRVIE
jgi:hypothetical protein